MVLPYRQCWSFAAHGGPDRVLQCFDPSPTLKRKTWSPPHARPACAMRLRCLIDDSEGCVGVPEAFGLAHGRSRCYPSGGSVRFQGVSRGVEE